MEIYQLCGCCVESTKVLNENCKAHYWTFHKCNMHSMFSYRHCCCQPVTRFYTYKFWKCLAVMDLTRKLIAWSISDYLAHYLVDVITHYWLISLIKGDLNFSKSKACTIKTYSNFSPNWRQVCIRLCFFHMHLIIATYCRILHRSCLQPSWERRTLLHLSPSVYT